MRKERTKSKQRDVYKVWLTDDEIEQLRRAAVSRRDDIIIQLRCVRWATSLRDSAGLPEAYSSTR